MFRDGFDWEDAWGVLAFLVAIVTACVLLTAVLADHNVRSYYMGPGQAGAVCIQAELTWDVDAVVACSGDHDRMIGELERLNATIPKRR